jgi:hypothetical protein
MVGVLTGQDEPCHGRAPKTAGSSTAMEQPSAQDGRVLDEILRRVQGARARAPPPASPAAGSRCSAASEIKRAAPAVPDLNQVFLAEDEDEDSSLSAVARGCSSLRSLALWDVPHVTDAELAGSGSSRRRSSAGTRLLLKFLYRDLIDI